jgi:polyisoprenoid-binding protein YceI
MNRLKLFFLLGVFAVLSSIEGFAQKYFTKNASVRFFSKAPLENIEAKNSQAICVVEVSSMEIEVSMLMRAFEFHKALMQEHFNENYVESDKFPKSNFKGKITSPENLSTQGSFPAKVKGQLSLHGVTHEIEAEGKITVSGDKISIESVFFIKPEDYGIKIEKMYLDKIAKEIEVTVLAQLQKKQ